MTDTAGPDSGPHDKLTTDPPRPPGTPDVDDLVGEVVARPDPDRIPPDDAAADSDPQDIVSVEPTD